MYLYYYKLKVFFYKNFDIFKIVISQNKLKQILTKYKTKKSLCTIGFIDLYINFFLNNNKIYNRDYQKRIFRAHFSLTRMLLALINH